MTVSLTPSWVAAEHSGCPLVHPHHAAGVLLWLGSAHTCVPEWTGRASAHTGRWMRLAWQGLQGLLQAPHVRGAVAALVRGTRRLPVLVGGTSRRTLKCGTFSRVPLFHRGLGLAFPCPRATAVRCDVAISLVMCITAAPPGLCHVSVILMGLSDARVFLTLV